MASLALLSDDGAILFAGQSESNRNAAGTCLRILGRGLAEAGRTLSDIAFIVADIGPGSFIGVRVGVTIAKTMAFALGVPVAGVTSFDLIDSAGTAVVPSKRGEYFVRPSGLPAVRTSILPEGEPFLGYGPEILQQRYPDACLSPSLLSGLKKVRPEELLPDYLIEPSISFPKRPYIQANP